MTSFVDRPIVLAEVFHPELFTELCSTYVDLYGIGIRVFDDAHDKLVDVTFAGGLLGWLFEFAEPRRRLTAFITDLKSKDVARGEWLVRSDDVTGGRYLITAITHEQDVLGKVVVGPYLPDDEGDFAPSGEWTDALDFEKYASLRAEMRRINDRTLRKVVAGLVKAVDVVCHAGYKQVLTSQMHLESITIAYEDLQRKNRELEENNALLEETNERLREVDKLKSNFLATVSHELRTPLTSVIGYSEMLLEGLAGDLAKEQRDYIKTIMDKGESLLHLISGILDISKIEKGAQQIVREPVLPEALIDSALSFVTPQAAKKRIAIEVEQEPGLPVLLIDGYKVRQVLVNLLGNAVKFTGEAGRIDVRVNRYKPLMIEAGVRGTDFVRFEIADNGIGIPTDKLDRIFETFYQVDNSSTREYGGTGLGLAIVKNFVESHGGKVYVESQLDRGSTFAFILPVETDVLILTPPPGVR